MNIQKIINIDRRIIFVFIFLSVLIPFLIDFDMPITAGKNVRAVYDNVERVGREGGTMLISFDFDNASRAELDPMARSILSHAYMKGVKVVAMGNWPNGVELAKNLMIDMAKEYNKVEGEDWAYLGYKPGGALLMVSMGKDFQNAFPQDFRRKKTTELPITKNIMGLTDFGYIISFSAGVGGIEEWVIYAQTKYKFPFGGACTAVMAPDFFPFIQTGQLSGLIGGLAGAAEYEALINKPGAATTGMKPRSVAHIVLIFFILFGNFCYFMGMYLDKKKEVNDGN